MSYTTDRIARRREESATFRAAYDEEVELTRQEKARREALMGAVANMRKSQRLTQRAVAKEMHVSQARVSQMERGVETLSVDRLLELIAVLQGEIVILTSEEVKAYGLESKLIPAPSRRIKGTKKQDAVVV